MNSSQMLANGVPGSNRARPARSITWTPQADARLGQLVADGQSIRSLAKSFGIGRQAAQQRALKLGLIAPETCKARTPPDAPKIAADVADLCREALPAGHPLTWGLIVQGTCLEGSAYSTPDTSRLRRASANPGGVA